MEIHHHVDQSAQAALNVQTLKHVLTKSVQTHARELVVQMHSVTLEIIVLSVLVTMVILVIRSRDAIQYLV